MQMHAHANASPLLFFNWLLRSAAFERLNWLLRIICLTINVGREGTIRTCWTHCKCSFHRCLNRFKTNVFWNFILQSFIHTYFLLYHIVLGPVWTPWIKRWNWNAWKTCKYLFLYLFIQNMSIAFLYQLCCKKSVLYYCAILHKSDILLTGSPWYKWIQGWERRVWRFWI